VRSKGTPRTEGFGGADRIPSVASERRLGRDQIRRTVHSTDRPGGRSWQPPPARGGGRRGDQCRRTGRDRPEWLYGRLGRCLLGFGQKGSNRQVDMTANDSGRLPPVLAGAIVMTLRLVLGDSPPRVSTPQLTGNRTRWHPGEHHHDQQRPCAQHRSNSRCKPDASTGRRAIFQLKCASIQDLWDASGTFPHLRGESPSGPCPQVEPTRNEIMSEA